MKCIILLVFDDIDDVTKVDKQLIAGSTAVTLIKILPGVYYREKQETIARNYDKNMSLHDL